jgi:hypothetical protein
MSTIRILTADLVSKHSKRNLQRDTDVLGSFKFENTQRGGITGPMRNDELVSISARKIECCCHETLDIILSSSFPHCTVSYDTSKKLEKNETKVQFYFHFLFLSYFHVRENVLIGNSPTCTQPKARVPSQKNM